MYQHLWLQKCKIKCHPSTKYRKKRKSKKTDISIQQINVRVSKFFWSKEFGYVKMQNIKICLL